MKQKTNFVSIIFFVWCLLSIIAYMFFSSSVTYIQTIGIYLPFLEIRENLSVFFLLRYWRDAISSFFGIFFFTVSCIFFGKLIFKITRLKFYFSFTLLTTWFLVGNAVYSIIFLLLATIGKFSANLTLLLLFMGCGAGFDKNLQKFFFRYLLAIHSYKQNAMFSPLILIILFLALLSTSARISYDSTAIYFSDAKITAYSQGIQYFKEGTFIASAFQNSIQFSAIIQVFGEQSARMLSWVCGTIIIMFVVSISKRLGNTRKINKYLLTLLVTSTAFIDLFGDGKVDLINSAYAIAAVYWMVLKEEYQTKQNNILIGFLLGMAIIGRPYNVFLLLVFAFLYYVQKAIWHPNVDLPSFLRSIAWISFGAIPVGLYHFFVNWLIQGNPFAFLGSISSINSATGPWDNKPETMLALRLFYPFVTTFRNTPQSLGNISPLVIGLIPFWLIPAIRKTIQLSTHAKIVFRTALLTLILWIFLFFTVVEIRYVFFLWFILLIPAAQLIASVITNVDTVVRNLIIITIHGLLVFMIYRTGTIAVSTYSPIDEGRNPHCKEHIICEYAINPINHVAQPNERVLSLSAYRYYLRNDLFICSSKHDEYSLLQIAANQSADAFWREIVRQGYQYIAYELDYTTRHLQLSIIPSPENTPDWIKLEVLNSPNTNFASSYKLVLDNPPIATEKKCRINQDNLLEVQLLP